MHHFAHIFIKLEGIGAAATGAGKLVTLVAEAPCDNPAPLNLSNVDVVDRKNFRGTHLWATYCVHIFELLMKKAQKELQGSNSAWQTTLNTDLDIHPVSEASVETARKNMGVG